MSTDKQVPPPAANDENSALATLKALLVGPEQSSIRELEKESQDPERQRRRIADALPDSLNEAYRDSPRQLTRSLEMPVSECIEGSVKRNPAFFADILYPVMGPAIRRSIAQTMRELVQHINQTLEHSLTVKGLKWRAEAARSGIPFAEIVLRHTLRYRVEEAFLIQSGSGLLIQHVRQQQTHTTDADAVSAMLTAIRDFAHDTLDTEDEDARLETVDVGEHTLWLVHGPRAYLACAIRGIPPVGLRDELTGVVEEIHRRHAGLLQDFDGDPASATALIPLMEPCLQMETATPRGKRFPWPLLLLALAAAGLLAWWGHAQWQAHTLTSEQRSKQMAAVTALSNASGIVLTDWRIDGERLQVQGLHDPLTPSPEGILAESGLSADEVRQNFRPFQSSEPTAARARAEQRLAPPAGIRLTLDEQGVLRAQGSADPEWIERAALLATTIPGVNAYDDSGLHDQDERIRKQLSELLMPPPQAIIEVSDGAASIKGEAPLSWIESLPAARPQIDGLTGLVYEQLKPLEMQRLAALINMIESTRVAFASGTAELGGAQLTQLDSLAALIGEAHQYAQDMHLALELQIIGRTDGTGSAEQNLYLARERAARVAQRLAQYDTPLPGISLSAIPQPAAHAAPDDEMRRVEFRMLGAGQPEGTDQAKP